MKCKIFCFDNKRHRHFNEEDMMVIVNTWLEGRDIDVKFITQSEGGIANIFANAYELTITIWYEQKKIKS